MAFRRQVVTADVVPVADDQGGVAARAEGGAAFAVVNVAGEDMVQAGVEGDAAGLDQGGGRCRREVVHLPVGVESGEVQRHVRPELAGDPSGKLVDLLRAVVLAGDQ